MEAIEGTGDVMVLKEERKAALLKRKAEAMLSLSV